jgi:hypothetical protein
MYGFQPATLLLSKVAATKSKVAVKVEPTKNSTYAKLLEYKNKYS